MKKIYEDTNNKIVIWTAGQYYIVDVKTGRHSVSIKAESMEQAELIAQERKGMIICFNDFLSIN